MIEYGHWKLCVHAFHDMHPTTSPFVCCVFFILHSSHLLCLHGQDHDREAHNSTDSGSSHAKHGGGSRAKRGRTRNTLWRRHLVDAGRGIGQDGIGLGLIVRGGTVGRNTALISRHKGGNGTGVGVVTREGQDGVVLLATSVRAGIIQSRLLGCDVNGTRSLIHLDAIGELRGNGGVVGRNGGLQGRILVDDSGFGVTDSGVTVDSVDQEEESSDDVLGVDEHGDIGMMKQQGIASLLSKDNDCVN